MSLKRPCRSCVSNLHIIYPSSTLHILSDPHLFALRNARTCKDMSSKLPYKWILHHPFRSCFWPVGNHHYPRLHRVPSLGHLPKIMREGGRKDREGKADREDFSHTTFLFSQKLQKKKTSNRSPVWQCNVTDFGRIFEKNKSLCALVNRRLRS